jgi:GDP-4-dehydro-6-deoxy-D-mannose reductase
MPPRRVLITGGGGFVGQWVARGMLKRGWSVVAASRGGPRHRVLDDRERAAVRWAELDVTSDESIRRALDAASPDSIVHLAGMAFPADANADPIRAFETNALGVLRLINALGPQRGTGVRLLVIGSAEQYGPHPESEYPLPETAAQRPVTPYAIAKASQELLALQAHRGQRLHVVCTRSFNHTGPGHGDSYLLPTLVRRARELPKSGGALSMGNGTPRRDYLHVADVAEAYMLLLEHGVPGEVYNVCRGTAITVRELGERVLKRMGITADISTEATLLRPHDTPILLGDNAKLRAATGWTPTRSIDDIIDDLIHAAKS